MQNSNRAIRYNSELENLIIPEYGRHIQNLINHAVSIEDKNERAEAAKHIVKLMAQISNPGRPSPEIELKLWRHLFIISDFKIDVTPEDIELPLRENRDLKPQRIEYPKNTKIYRHYGSYVQELIDKALEEKDEEKRKGFFSSIASYMKTAYKVWNRDPHIGDENIIADLESIIGDRGELPDDLNIKAAHVNIPSSSSRDNKRRRKGGKSNNSGRRRRKR